MRLPAWRSLRSAAWVTAIGLMSVLLWRVEAALDRTAAETAAREAQACETTLNARAEQERLLVDLVTQLGGRQQVIDTIHQAYGDLPEPASCAP